jgi:hypothetical protein
VVAEISEINWRGRSWFFFPQSFGARILETDFFMRREVSLGRSVIPHHDVGKPLLMRHNNAKAKT